MLHGCMNPMTLVQHDTVQLGIHTEDFQKFSFKLKSFSLAHLTQIQQKRNIKTFDQNRKAKVFRVISILHWGLVNNFISLYVFVSYPPNKTNKHSTSNNEKNVTKKDKHTSIFICYSRELFIYKSTSIENWNVIRKTWHGRLLIM